MLNSQMKPTLKKINFYTCKYFEGWDMYDEQATLILVTNIHRMHTKVGIADKGAQFFGRLRGKRAQMSQLNLTN